MASSTQSARPRFWRLLRRILPDRWAYAITRWKNIRFQHLVYRRTRTRPQSVRKKLLGMVRKAGFANAGYRNLTFGVACLHSGWKI